MKPTLDPTRLTEDQRSKLESYQQAQDQLQALQDIASMTHELINVVEGHKKHGNQTNDNIGTLLVDIRENLAKLSSKEALQPPDYAKPVVEAISRLETALNASIKAIDVKPNVKVDAPNINVPETNVNLDGVEKALKTMPKALEQAIKLIPQVPETDLQPLLDAWQGISEQLLSIENATRSKPLPGSMKANQSGVWDVGTQTTTHVHVGQTTSATTATKLSTDVTPVTNGILVQALSTNVATVFIGGSNVSLTNGWELQAGQCIPFAVDNISDLYVIGANGTDKICWNIT